MELTEASVSELRARAMTSDFGRVMQSLYAGEVSSKGGL
jgi:hypothetical protein